MELQTRLLTFEEMYFKKPITAYLPAPPATPVPDSSLNSTIVEMTNQLIAPSLQQPIPKIDLSNEIFPLHPVSENKSTFLNKYWVWLTLGCGVIAVVSVIMYNKQQKKNSANTATK